MYKIGDRVRVLRWARSHRDGWEDTWIEQMNSAIGQVGTVKSVVPENKEVKLDIPGNRGDGFFYPESVLELENPVLNPIAKSVAESVVAQPVFEVGNRVQISNFKINPSLVGRTGIVAEVRLSGYIRVKFDDGPLLYLFLPNELVLIDSPVAPTLSGFIPDGSTNTTYLSPVGGTTLAVPIHAKVVNLVFIEAKKIAKRIGHAYGYATIDMIQDRLEATYGAKNKNLGNAAGQVFRGKDWYRVGTQKSARSNNHGRRITKWKYIGK